jgi:hypothetical protein
MRDVCGWENETLKSFQADETLALTSGWSWWHEDVVAISDRPRVLTRDTNNRLHNTSGPALLYPDGWAIYSWHGVTVPQWLIEQPELITAAKIKEETNQEIRRCMIDRFGAERFISECGGKLLNTDKHGKLWGDDNDWRAVEVLNGTVEPDGERKKFFLTVPPTCRTAKEAVAWTYGLEATEYREEVRT